MNNLLLPALVALLALATLLALAATARRLYVVARPDQWLVHLRNGRLQHAGVGISSWRRPGDVIVRFSSTMQRVRFEITCLSSDHVPVGIEGFILWSVSARDDGPFLAYRKMGLGDVTEQPADMASRNHLLTTAQHRAFRMLITAEVQRHASTFPLTKLLSLQDGFVEGLRTRLIPLTDALGIDLDQVQIADIRPTDPDLVADLAAEQLEAVRDDAARVRLDTTERRELREVHSRTRLAQQRADAEVDQKAADARAQLELERQRAALREEQLAYERKRLELERDRQLAELDSERQVREARQTRDADLNLDAERHLRALEAARLQRAQDALNARTAELRLDAAARRDASILLAEAEEQKSEPLRQHELQQLTLQTVATTLHALPFKDARWISVGNDSPLSSLLGMVESFTTLTRKPD